ncbi:hypothetical protein BBJ28_00008853 [Nothophytophthora sp. Chile5]|nr:hypothetical protein BBJ28_00008853 [Nothophytophthora sp. Chile5]
MAPLFSLAQCLALILSAACSGVTAQAPAVIAREEIVSFTVNTTGTEAFSRSIGSTGATFLTLHFAQFHLAPGASLTVRSSNNLARYEYTGLGRGDLGENGGFFSSLIPGSEAVIEYTPEDSVASSGDFGFTIDKLTRSSSGATTNSICGADDTKPAKCYENDSALPQAYAKSQALSRLFVSGTSSCTGWLVGSQGHLLTNFHCIGSDVQAATTDFEFGAESASCEEQCQVKNGCRGTVAATTSTLVASSESLDYALVKLNPMTGVNLSEYGFLTLRVAGAVLGEQIYLPQHPKGWAKRIAAVDDDGNATTVIGVDHSSACGDHRIGYYADTQPGSSGSPLIAAADNSVIALHNCGVLDAQCENSAIDIRAVIWDLMSKGVVPNDALDNPTASLVDGPWIPGITSAPTPTTTPAPTVSICTIFRQQTSCETVVPGNECIWQNGKCVDNN